MQFVYIHVKCNSCEGIPPIAIHIPLLPMASFLWTCVLFPCPSVHVQVSLCVYMSVHVCTLGIVHKEQCYNDSENLWFTVIGYQFMNCLLPTPDSDRQTDMRGGYAVDIYIYIYIYIYI